MKKLYYKPTSKYIQLDAESLLQGPLGSIIDGGTASGDIGMTHKQEPAIEETNSPW